jgi:helix-turn-helix protein
MSESVIADFVANFNSDRMASPDPVKGRVLLSRRRLVLAVNDDDKLTIPLSSVLDVAVGHVPEGLDGFFDSTVTVVFEGNGRRFVAVVEGVDDKIGKFSTLLFTALLNSTEATVKHPARVGGRVTAAEFVPAKLSVKPQCVECKTSDGTVEISLAAVTELERSNREIASATRPVLQVRHVPQGESMLTTIATSSSRKMSILGRYLRLEYSNITNELEEIEIADAEKEILVAIYSGAGTEGGSLPQIVNTEPAKVTMVLNRLEENELVVDSPEGTKLTPKGQVVVNKHLEGVTD